MIPKEIKYNLDYDDVWGDLLRPPHGITPAKAFTPGSFPTGHSKVVPLLWVFFVRW